MRPMFDGDMDDKPEAKSSDASPLDAAPDPAKASDAAADPSPANDDDKGADRSTVDVVRDVVKGDRPAPAASSADGSEQDQTAGASSKEPDNDAYSDVPFHKHPRFQHLIAERNGFKQDAERHRNVQTFLDTNGLSSEEAADALVIFAKAKIDPVGAWQTVKPWVQQLLISAGEVLPEDLQSRVQKGELSPDAAFEISRARAGQQSTEKRQSFSDQQRDRQAKIAHSNTLQKTAADWETDRVRLDPNFEAKRTPLMKELAYLQATEGRPDAPEGVLDQLKRAYKAVNDGFKPVAAPRVENRPALKPVIGGQVSSSVREEPKSTLEIIRANRRHAS